MAAQARVIPPEQAAPAREIPKPLSELAQRALAPEPRDRIPSALEFVAALRDYLTGADKRRESLQLHAQVAQQLEAADAGYPALTEALNQLDRCLVLWPENHAAQQLRYTILGRYARAALANRDLTLARLQAERLPPDPEQQLLLREITELEEHQRRQEELLDQAYRQARHERDVAEEARQRADHMRSRAENLVQFLLGDLHRDLWPIGRLDLLHRVAKKSLEYFDSLPESESTDSVLHNRAIAYLRIGDVLSDQGKKLEAGEAYRKARDIMRQLVEHEPEKIEWNRTLADSHESHGQVLYYQGKTAEALFEHTKALGIREWIAQRFPDDPTIHKDVASSRHRMGVVFWRQQDLQRALAFHLDAIETYRRLARDTPDDIPLKAATAWALSTLGNVHRDLGQLHEAVEFTREGLVIRESLAASEPNNTVRLDDVLWTRSNLALLLLLQSKLEESLDIFRKDMELRRQLVKADTENVVRLNSLTFCMSLAAEVLFALHRVGEAESIVSECIELSRSLMGRDSASSQAVAAYARLCGQLAEYLVAQHRWEEAEPYMHTASEIARKAVEKAPHSVMSIKVLIVNLVLAGRAAKHNGAAGQAEQFWDEAWRLLQSLKITDQELDVLDLNAQLLLLRNTPAQAAPFIERLRARRWITPTLHGVCRETGYSLPE
jgi:tetratricopeptide (TPR) repeat protein